MSRGTLVTLSHISISTTGFSPSMIGLPMPFVYLHAYISASLTPNLLLDLVWPLPLSLATTRGISVDFFSSPYLDVSVQAVPPIYLFYSVYGTWT